MKIYSLFEFVLLLSLTSCGFLISKSTVTGIKIRKLTPLYNKEWKVIGYDTNHNYVYYYKDFVIYNSYYLYDSSNKLSFFEGEKRYFYYLHKSNDSFGYIYDKYKKLSGVKLSYNSTKSSIITLNEDMATSISAPNSHSKLINTNFNKDSTILVNVYKYEGGGGVFKNDTLSSGLIYVTYDKRLLDFKYTLSKSLDTVRNLKLRKIFVVNNPIYYKELDKTFDTPNQLIEIDTLSIDNTKENELLKYFLKHEKLRRQELNN